MDNEKLLVALDRATLEVRGLAGEVDELRRDLKAERLTRRATTYIGVALMIAMMILGGLVYKTTQDIGHDRKVAAFDNCRRINDSRSELRQAFELLIEASNRSRASGPPLTEEEETERQLIVQTFLNDINTSFPSIDC